MDDLRMYLGSHDGLSPLQLHKEEVASLIIRAGRKKGFVVRTEVEARWAASTGRSPALDCGWYRDGRLVVAFEFDGRDVADGHLTKDTGNVAKFMGCIAPLQIQVLYSVKNDLKPKPPSRRSFVERLLAPTEALVVDDTELMRPGGIERLMEMAWVLSQP